MTDPEANTNQHPGEGQNLPEAEKVNPVREGADTFRGRITRVGDVLNDAVDNAGEAGVQTTRVLGTGAEHASAGAGRVTATLWNMVGRFRDSYKKQRRRPGEGAHN